jgi:hypothetical protein
VVVGSYRTWGARHELERRRFAVNMKVTEAVYVERDTDVVPKPVA